MAHLRLPIARAAFPTAMLMSLGCGDGDPYDLKVTPEGSVHFVEGSFGTGSSGRLLLVLVVDDTQDAAGEALREKLGREISEELDRAFPLRSVWEPLWQPVNVAVALVWPSASPEARLVVRFAEDGLVLDVRDRQPGELEGLSERLASAIAAPPEPLQAFSPLEATWDVWRLLVGRRSARSASEQTLLDRATVPETFTLVHLAAAHDDASGGVPGDYAVVAGDLAALGSTDPENWESGSSLGQISVAPPCETQPRLTTWVQDARVVRPGWCTENAEVGPSLGLFADGPHHCLANPPRVDQDGSADCRVFIGLNEPLDECPAEYGWEEPRDLPAHLGFNVSELETVCEMTQLSGDALAACRATTPLESTVSGWCVIGPEGNGGCEVGRYARLNYVGGVFGDRSSLSVAVYYVCNVAAGGQ